MPGDPALASEQEPALPPPRPMAKVRRVALLAREVRERLSDAALDVLFSAIEIVAEGKVDRGEFFGSVMLSVDLAACGAQVRDCDAAAARRAAELMNGDARVQRRAAEIARPEAERVAGGALGRPEGEVRVRARGTRLHIDVDIQGRLR